MLEARSPALSGTTDPNLIFPVVWFASSALCILGFAIANAYLGFNDEVSDFTQA